MNIRYVRRRGWMYRLLWFVLAVGMSCVPVYGNGISAAGPAEEREGDTRETMTEKTEEAESAGETGQGLEDRKETVAGDGSVEDSETKDPDVKETEEETGSLYFSIDDQHVFDGMESSYNKGYSPKVEKGQAVLILPLITDREYLPDEITVTPQLGETSGSPFVYRSYQKTIRQTEEKATDGKKYKVYLVRLELKLAAGRKNGTYPVEIEIRAKDRKGERICQEFTQYVRIVDGVSEHVSEGGYGGGSDDSVESPKSQPVLLIREISYSSDRIYAGDEFSVDVTIYNTSEEIPVRNMTITPVCNGDGIRVTDDGGVLYVDSIPAEGDKKITVHLRSRPDTPEGIYDMEMDMSYDNPEAVTLASSGKIGIEICQRTLVEGAFSLIPESVNAGDTFSLDLSAANMGKSPVYNVRFEMDVPGLIPSGLSYLGNLEAGSAGEGAMKLFVNTRNVNSDGTKRDLDPKDWYGETEGILTMIYEDASGQEYREDYDVRLTIQALEIGGSEDTADYSEAGMGRQWIMGILVIGFLAAAGAGWIVLKKSIRKKDIRKDSDI